ncbi:hypothetical protein HIM_00702 [Hirsutella minnesotensis 3608]|nr:hypothetical protein HIM_00702 [Hirsutella minnesotensis 3608]
MAPSVLVALCITVLTWTVGRCNGEFPDTRNWVLADTYDASNFFSKFNFITEQTGDADRSIFQSEPEAFRKRLVGAAEGEVYIGPDVRKRRGRNSSPCRDSVRIESKANFTQGLLIARFSHIPRRLCGLVPAFRICGDDRRGNGEDYLLGTSRSPPSQSPFPTGRQNRDESRRLKQADQTAVFRNNNCITAHLTDRDCVATLVDDLAEPDGGSVWDQAPANIDDESPDCSTWGPPTAWLTRERSDTQQHFANRRIVLEYDFCGNLDGLLDAWESHSGAQVGGRTCAEFITNFPRAFEDSYFGIKDIKYFQEMAGLSRPLLPAEQETNSQNDRSSLLKGFASDHPLMEELPFIDTAPALASNVTFLPEIILEEEVTSVVVSEYTYIEETSHFSSYYHEWAPFGHYTQHNIHPFPSASPTPIHPSQSPPRMTNGPSRGDRLHHPPAFASTMDGWQIGKEGYGPSIQPALPLECLDRVRYPEGCPIRLQTSAQTFSDTAYSTSVQQLPPVSLSDPISYGGQQAVDESYDDMYDVEDGNRWQRLKSDYQQQPTLSSFAATITEPPSAPFPDSFEQEGEEPNEYPFELKGGGPGDNPYDHIEVYSLEDGNRWQRLKSGYQQQSTLSSFAATITEPPLKPFPNSFEQEGEQPNKYPFELKGGGPGDNPYNNIQFYGLEDGNRLQENFQQLTTFRSFSTTIFSSFATTIFNSFATTITEPPSAPFPDPFEQDGGGPSDKPYNNIQVYGPGDRGRLQELEPGFLQRTTFSSFATTFTEPPSAPFPDPFEQEGGGLSDSPYDNIQVYGLGGGSRFQGLEPGFQQQTTFSSFATTITEPPQISFSRPFEQEGGGLGDNSYDNVQIYGPGDGNKLQGTEPGFQQQTTFSSFATTITELPLAPFPDPFEQEGGGLSDNSYDDIQLYGLGDGNILQGLEPGFQQQTTFSPFTTTITEPPQISFPGPFGQQEEKPIEDTFGKEAEGSSEGAYDNLNNPADANMNQRPEPSSHQETTYTPIATVISETPSISFSNDFDQEGEKPSGNLDDHLSGSTDGVILQGPEPGSDQRTTFSSFEFTTLEPLPTSFSDPFNQDIGSLGDHPHNNINSLADGNGFQEPEPGSEQRTTFSSFEFTTFEPLPTSFSAPFKQGIGSLGDHPYNNINNLADGNEFQGPESGSEQRTYSSFESTTFEPLPTLFYDPFKQDVGSPGGHPYNSIYDLADGSGFQGPESGSEQRTTYGSFESTIFEPLPTPFLDPFGREGGIPEEDLHDGASDFITRPDSRRPYQQEMTFEPYTTRTTFTFSTESSTRPYESPAQSSIYDETPPTISTFPGNDGENYSSALHENVNADMTTYQDDYFTRKVIYEQRTTTYRFSKLHVFRPVAVPPPRTFQPELRPTPLSLPSSGNDFHPFVISQTNAQDQRSSSVDLHSNVNSYRITTSPTSESFNYFTSNYFPRPSSIIQEEDVSSYRITTSPTSESFNYFTSNYFPRPSSIIQGEDVSSYRVTISPTSESFNYFTSNYFPRPSSIIQEEDINSESVSYFTSNYLPRLSSIIQEEDVSSYRVTTSPTSESFNYFTSNYLPRPSSIIQEEDINSESVSYFTSNYLPRLSSIIQEEDVSSYRVTTSPTSESFNYFTSNYFPRPSSIIQEEDINSESVSYFTSSYLSRSSSIIQDEDVNSESVSYFTSNYLPRTSSIIQEEVYSSSETLRRPEPPTRTINPCRSRSSGPSYGDSALSVFASSNGPDFLTQADESGQLYCQSETFRTLTKATPLDPCQSSQPLDGQLNSFGPEQSINLDDSMSIYKHKGCYVSEGFTEAEPSGFLSRQGAPYQAMPSTSYAPSCLSDSLDSTDPNQASNDGCLGALDGTLEPQSSYIAECSDIQEQPYDSEILDAPSRTSARPTPYCDSNAPQDDDDSCTFATPRRRPFGSAIPMKTGTPQTPCRTRGVVVQSKSRTPGASTLPESCYAETSSISEALCSGAESIDTDESRASRLCLKEQKTIQPEPSCLPETPVSVCETAESTSSTLLDCLSESEDTEDLDESDSSCEGSRNQSTAGTSRETFAPDCSNTSQVSDMSSESPDSDDPCNSEASNSVDSGSSNSKKRPRPSRCSKSGGRKGSESFAAAKQTRSLRPNAPSRSACHAAARKTQSSNSNVTRTSRGSACTHTGSTNNGMAKKNKKKGGTKSGDSSNLAASVCADKVEAPSFMSENHGPEETYFKSENNVVKRKKKKKRVSSSRASSSFTTFRTASRTETLTFTSETEATTFMSENNIVHKLRKNFKSENNMVEKKRQKENSRSSHSNDSSDLTSSMASTTTSLIFNSGNSAAQKKGKRKGSSTSSNPTKSNSSKSPKKTAKSVDYTLEGKRKKKGGRSSSSSVSASSTITSASTSENSSRSTSSRITTKTEAPFVKSEDNALEKKRKKRKKKRESSSTTKIATSISDNSSISTSSGMTTKTEAPIAKSEDNALEKKRKKRRKKKKTESSSTTKTTTSTSDNSSISTSSGMTTKTEAPIAKSEDNALEKKRKKRKKKRESSSTTKIATSTSDNSSTSTSSRMTTKTEAPITKSEDNALEKKRKKRKKKRESSSTIKTATSTSDNSSKSTSSRMTTKTEAPVAKTKDNALEKKRKRKKKGESSSTTKTATSISDNTSNTTSRMTTKTEAPIAKSEDNALEKKRKRRKKKKEMEEEEETESSSTAEIATSTSDNLSNTSSRIATKTKAPIAKSEDNALEKKRKRKKKRKKGESSSTTKTATLRSDNPSKTTSSLETTTKTQGSMDFKNFNNAMARKRKSKGGSSSSGTSTSESSGTSGSVVTQTVTELKYTVKTRIVTRTAKLSGFESSTRKTVSASETRSKPQSSKDVSEPSSSSRRNYTKTQYITVFQSSTVTYKLRTSRVSEETSETSALSSPSSVQTVEYGQSIVTIYTTITAPESSQRSTTRFGQQSTWISRTRVKGSSVELTPALTAPMPTKAPSLTRSITVFVTASAPPAVVEVEQPQPLSLALVTQLAASITTFLVLVQPGSTVTVTKSIQPVASGIGIVKIYQQATKTITVASAVVTKTQTVVPSNAQITAIYSEILGEIVMPEPTPASFALLQSQAAAPTPLLEPGLLTAQTTITRTLTRTHTITDCGPPHDNCAMGPIATETVVFIYYVGDGGNFRGAKPTVFLVNDSPLPPALHQVTPVQIAEIEVAKATIAGNVFQVGKLVPEPTINHQIYNGVVNGAPPSQQPTFRLGLSGNQLQTPTLLPLPEGQVVGLPYPPPNNSQVLDPSGVAGLLARPLPEPPNYLVNPGGSILQPPTLGRPSPERPILGAPVPGLTIVNEPAQGRLPPGGTISSEPWSGVAGPGNVLDNPMSGLTSPGKASPGIMHPYRPNPDPHLIAARPGSGPQICHDGACAARPLVVNGATNAGISIKLLATFVIMVLM